MGNLGRKEMGRQALWALWVAVICVALGEVDTVQEASGGSPVVVRHKLAHGRLRWRDMTANDHQMATNQGGFDDETRAMAYAQQQSSEQSVFSLDSTDTQEAAAQASRPAWNGEVQREANYLATSLDPVSSDSSPTSWEKTRRAALRRSREVSLKLEDMRAGDLELGDDDELEHHHAVSDSLRRLAAELSSLGQPDLGESQSAGTQSDEKIEKAKEKARLQMKTVTEAHLGRINVTKKHMKE